MQNITKRVFSLVVAIVMVLVMLPTGTPQASAATSVNMYYDDRLPVSELGGNSGSSVNISNQSVTSKQVGSSSADSAVLTYTGGNLIAVGTGTAKVTVDGTAYNVTVTAAPISLLMITGHSIGAGQKGVAAQSVKGEAGQVYSTHGTGLASASATGVGIGYAASSRPSGIDAFVSGGVIGEAGALANRWNQLTGEKIWVLNTAVGGTSARKWTKGTTAYDNAVAVFKYAQAVMANEVAAGHYTLKEESIIYHSGANWGWSDNGTWDDVSGKGLYDSMLSGFKSDLGVDGIGMVPIYTQSGYNSYTNDDPAAFFMSASESYPNVYMASYANRTWLRDMSTFPAINYTTHGTAVTKPTSASALYSDDAVHLSQVAYNALGIDIAENVYKFLRGDNTATSVTFKTTSGGNVADEIVMKVGDTLKLIPETTPQTASDLSFVVSKNLSVSYPFTVTAEADGLGTVKVMQGTEVIKTLTLAVGDTSVPVEPGFPDGWSVTYHCVCGNSASTGNACAIEGHVPVQWQPWTITNTAPFLPGYWYLPNDLDLTSANYKYGTDFSTATAVIGLAPTVEDGVSEYYGSKVDVYVDLNGKTITGRSTHRIFRLENDYGHTLSICDTAGGGKIVPTTSGSTTNRGMGIWTRGKSNVVNFYGGTLDASGVTMSPYNNYAEAAAVSNSGTFNMYGGKIIGGTCTSSSGQYAQGGTIKNFGGAVLNVYGGVIQGGTVTGATVQGGNIRNEGTLNIYGGLIQGGTANGTNCQGANVSNTGTFFMQGGTISGGVGTDTDGGQGGCLFTTTGGTMTDGKIVDGKVAKNGGSNGHYGGCVYVYAGTFTMNGGTIQAYFGSNCAYRGGAVYVRSASGNKFVMNGGVVSAGSVSDYGAAIGTEGSGTIQINGGTVTAAFYADGTPITDPKDAMIEGAQRTASAGGCIGTWSGTINITGGTLIAGKGGGAGGGAVSVHGGTKLTMTGGQIVGGTATGTNKLYGGTAISVYSSGSKFTMTGGLITGGQGWRGAVHVRNGGAIEVSGDAQIYGNKDAAGSECNVLLSNIDANGSYTYDTKLTVGTAGLGENAKIGVSMDNPGVFTTGAADETKFQGDAGQHVVKNADGTLSITTHAGRTHCVCGGTYDHAHTDITGEWQPWDGKSNLTAGNYYLTQSLTGSTQYWMGGAYNNTEEMTINLCLNGYSIDSNYRVFGVAPKVTLNLMNCHSSESVLTGCCSTLDVGRVIHLHATTSTVNMYGNIKLVGKEPADRMVAYGGVINCSGTFNMYGGTLVGSWIGGFANGSAYEGRGGIVRINNGGKFNVYGGTLYGGDGGRDGTTAVKDASAGTYTSRSYGGVAYLESGAEMNVYGGTFYGSSVGDGGIIWATGGSTKVNIYGGTLYAGNAAFGGGAIKMSGGSNLTMTGGVIDGINPERPRDIRNAGGAGGGGIMLWDSHATIAGNAVIRNCYTSNEGGAIKAASGSCTLTLGGNVQLTGNGKGDVNANTPNDVYLEAGVVMTLDGLTTDANVGICMTNPGVFAKTGASEALADVFTSNDSAFFVMYGDNGLYLGAPLTMDGKAYSGLEAALADVKEGSFITLGETQMADPAFDVNVTLDLNGYDLIGDVTVATGKTLTLIDSATADYDASDRGMVKGSIDGTVARFFNTSKSTYGYNYKYLTIQEEEGWSSHRIYLSVQSAVLNPYRRQLDGSVETALNYKTVFKCNDVVAEYIDDYGLVLTGDNTVYAEYGRQLKGEGELNAFTTRLAGIMSTNNTPAQNTANAQKDVEAAAFIRLYDGFEATSAEVAKNLKEVIAEANICNTLTEDQRFVLGKMYQSFQDTLDTWTDIYLGRIRLCYHEDVLNQPIVADKQVALTFDDGPNTNSMVDMLDILATYDQKATFFLIGDCVTEENKVYIKRAYDEGHELGNHSYDHIRLGELSTSEALALIQQNQELIESITGEAPKYVRYPFNHYTADLLANTPIPQISGTGYGDYNAGVTAKDIADAVISTVTDGTIMLLHVSEGYDWTEESMHIIIPELRSLGYEITTVSGLFEAQGVEPQTGIFYTRVDEAK